ncbi:glutathione S-transferase [Chitinimonas viridis]|uniref:Glutathione S-transferase n=1 Tax=Chitinimonas viridis TaxID=664880 RepID=A0ABT8B600_9NEIS|nr:glutathione S-transferase [Chitinimonas viridis]MDN3577175.1 glutathione S-transferase [Chitinimonas viridis]
MSKQPVKLYTFPLSGHAHRVRLALSLLNVPTELIEVDLRKAEHKQPDFLKLNTFGQVPVIDDNGTVIADSNAILVYLARKYGNSDWLPADAAGEAAVQRWLSVAAGLVAFGPAAARLVTVFGAGFNADEVINRSHNLLKVMDAELADRPFLIGSKPSIADIANYTYIAHAPEGNVALGAYPQVSAWLRRIEALPGFVGMQKTAVGLAA